jgi:hypothetical protein
VALNGIHDLAYLIPGLFRTNRYSYLNCGRCGEYEVIWIVGWSCFSDELKKQKERELTPVATWWALTVTYLKMTMAHCWRTARWSGNGNKGPTFKLAIPFARPYKRSYMGLSQNGGCHHDTTNFEQFLGTLYWDPSVTMSPRFSGGPYTGSIFHLCRRHASAAENRVAWRCARVCPHCSTN